MKGLKMENKTAKLLSGVAYLIWILGGIGSLIVSTSVSSAFKDTLFESLGNSVSMAMFLTSAFSVFSTGLLFFGLSAVLRLIETKLPNNADLNHVENKNDIGTSSSDDVLKF